jgi:putative FmdB family regulatory protein
MPIYEYQCKSNDCNRVFSETVLKLSDEPTECPVCGGPIRRIISQVNTNTHSWSEDHRAMVADFYDVPVERIPRKKPAKEI